MEKKEKGEKEMNPIKKIITFCKVSEELNKKRCFVCGEELKGKITIPFTINGTYFNICSDENCLYKIDNIIRVVNVAKTIKEMDKIFNEELKKS